MSITAMKQARKTFETISRVEGREGREGLVKTCTKAIENLDTAIQEAEATPKQDEEGPLVDGWQITLADGHAGYGVYAHMTEYPDEGAIFLLAAGAQPAPKQEPDTSLIVEIEFDDGEKKAIPVSGTAQNMRYLKAWLDRLWRERAAPLQAQPSKPLTDDDIHERYKSVRTNDTRYIDIYRDAEAAHNIKEQP